jgi:hypothetical protein
MFLLSVLASSLLPRVAAGLEIHLTPDAIRKAVQAAGNPGGEISLLQGAVVLKHFVVRLSPATLRVAVESEVWLSGLQLQNVSLSCRPRAMGPRLFLDDVRIESLDPSLTALRASLESAINTAPFAHLDLEERFLAPVSAAPYELVVANPKVSGLSVTAAFIALTLDGTVLVR